MYSHVIIHIPHASVHIPQDLLADFTAADLSQEMLVMTDRYCDDLFDAGYPRIIAPVSRLVCDMERFRDDHDEVMSTVGMGAVYTTCSDGTPLRTVDAEARERLLRRYYDPHHERLTHAVDHVLQHCGRCLIIDAHSFYPAPLPYEFDREPDRPDFCIGTDPFHTPPALALAAVSFLQGLGYSVKLNSPFAGTLVPSAHYRKIPEVTSVMIEVNRRLYMEPDGAKNAAYPTVKQVLSALLTHLAAM